MAAVVLKATNPLLEKDFISMLQTSFKLRATTLHENHGKTNSCLLLVFTLWLI